MVVLEAYNDVNLFLLQNTTGILTKQNTQLLHDFVEARQSALVRRLYKFKKSGVLSSGHLG